MGDLQYAADLGRFVLCESRAGKRKNCRQTYGDGHTPDHLAVSLSKLLQRFNHDSSFRFSTSITGLHDDDDVV
jgi:hypothetical protein